MIRRPRRSPLFPSTPLFRSSAVAHVALSIIRARRENHGERADDLRVGQEEVDETWSGNLGLAHEAGRHLQGGDQPLGDGARSEEHTSELQSQSNLVCRLLLE